MTVQLAVTDDLDLATVGTWSAMIDAVAAEGPGCVRLDLTRCLFIDAVGVGCLLRAHQRLQRDGARLVLLNPTSAVRCVLQICQVGQVMEIRVEQP